MSSIDPIGTSALAAQIDALLIAIGGSPNAGTATSAQTTGAQAAPSSSTQTGPPSGASGASSTPTSTQTTISNIALTIDAIARFGSDAAGTATPVQGTRPLLPTPPQTAAAVAGALPGEGLATSLAAALSQTVGGSGLFYEAHLAQWAAGNRSTASLLQEPQAQLSPNLDALLAAAVAEPGAAAQTSADAGQNAAGGQSAEPQTGLPADAAASTAGGASTAGAALTDLLVAVAADTGQPAAAPIPQTAVPTAQAAQTAPATPAPNPEAANAVARYAATAAASQPHALPPQIQNAAAPALTAAAAHAANGNAGAAALAAANNAGAAAAVATTAIHPATLPLIRQQLDMLGPQPQFYWRGEAWPGATLDWRVEEDRSHGAMAADGDQRVWRTRLTLELPSLGPVDADLSLSGNRLIARIQASPSSAARMTGGSAELRRRLAAAGLDLNLLSIGNGLPALPGAAAPADFDWPAAKNGKSGTGDGS